MNKTLALCLLLWFSWNAYAQDTLRIYTWEEALKAPKDSVFRLDASHLKWDVVPTELFAFTELRFLDLSKNRLADLPEELGSLKKLKALDVSKNKLTAFPIVLCQTTQLKKLLISRNQISSLPSCIGYYADLTTLDIWDNPITVLPEEFLQLKSLKTVDMRGILLSPSFQEKWRASMPEVKWHFDPPCKCME